MITNGSSKLPFLKEKYDKKKKYEHLKYTHKNGGFHMNAVPDTKLGAILMSVIKQIGVKVSKGDFSVMNISKPISLTQPISMLECIAKLIQAFFNIIHSAYKYFSTYLGVALKVQDPIEKMQLITTAMIAQLHTNQSFLHSRAPIDSSLGETIQLEKDDGTKFYAETIKTFPPTVIFKLYGPNDQYKFEGTDEIQADIHPTFTEIITKSTRINKLTFKDGREYEITYPKMIFEGILNGDRILNFMDCFTITCKQDKLIAKITLSYQVYFYLDLIQYKYQGKVRKLTSKVSGLFWAKQESVRNDLVDIHINKLVAFQEEDDEEDAPKVFTLATGSGCWTSYLEFDGYVIWRIYDPVLPWKSQENLLPSDSTLRKDRINMLMNNEDEAQTERIIIEDQDRKDAYLRLKKKK